MQPEPKEVEKFKILLDVAYRNFDMHHNIKIDAVKSMNNMIFILSTGTFVISMSFIGYLKIEIFHPTLLIISWALLLATIAGNMGAQYCTSKVSWRNQNLINEWIASKFGDNMNTDKDPVVKKFTEIGKKINVFVFCSLGAGMIFLFLFVGSNLLAQNALRSNPVADNNCYISGPSGLK